VLGNAVAARAYALEAHTILSVAYGPEHELLKEIGEMMDDIRSFNKEI
jgi:hypothetical protein